MPQGAVRKAEAVRGIAGRWGRRRDCPCVKTYLGVCAPSLIRSREFYPMSIKQWAQGAIIETANRLHQWGSTVSGYFLMLGRFLGCLETACQLKQQGRYQTNVHL